MTVLAPLIYERAVAHRDGIGMFNSPLRHSFVIASQYLFAAEGASILILIAASNFSNVLREVLGSEIGIREVDRKVELLFQSRGTRTGPGPDEHFVEHFAGLD